MGEISSEKSESLKWKSVGSSECALLLMIVFRCASIKVGKKLMVIFIVKFLHQLKEVSGLTAIWQI